MKFTKWAAGIFTIVGMAYTGVQVYGMLRNVFDTGELTSAGMVMYSFAMFWILHDGLEG
jgi:hypothetical protein